ncbi:MAG: cytochrome c biogenesis CcdA family protein [Candidatus Dormibacteria bacterium]
MNLISLAVAFGAGLISITSPCCLPLLPGYLGYISGTSPTRVTPTPPSRRPLVAAVLFVGGFTLVFTALGATASAIGGLLMLNREGLGQVAGAFILLMGLLILLGGRIGWFSRSGDWSQGWAKGQLWAAMPLGAAFALTWTPCIGPVLAGILTLAGTTGSVGQGVVLLLTYSLGLGVPFVALALSIDRVRGWLRRVARGTALLHYASGAVLAAMGVLLLTNQWLPLMSPLLRLYAKVQWPPV